MTKVYDNAKSALADIVADGQTIAVGGFGLCGIPGALIYTLKETGVKNLTCRLVLATTQVWMTLGSDCCYKPSKSKK